MIEQPVCLWQIIVFFGKAVKFPDIDTSASADTSLQQRAASRGGSVGAVICEGRNLGGIRPSFHSGGIIK